MAHKDIIETLASLATRLKPSPRPPGPLTPVRHAQICNSDKSKLGFAVGYKAKLGFADLPLLQHVALKRNNQKHRFVARNAATRRFEA